MRLIKIESEIYYAIRPWIIAYELSFSWSFLSLTRHSIKNAFFQHEKCKQAKLLSAWEIKKKKHRRGEASRHTFFVASNRQAEDVAMTKQRRIVLLRFEHHNDSLYMWETKYNNFFPRQGWRKLLQPNQIWTKLSLVFIFKEMTIRNSHDA